ncbi:hypothetical protein PLANTIT3_30049 [Plantibacter sp. T3]|nr:hypothetical protein PLANTIT3_30049 [Plantibacter sp. T3]
MFKCFPKESLTTSTDRKGRHQLHEVFGI